MLRNIWIVLGAFALVTVAHITAFAVEEVQQPVVQDDTVGGAAEPTTWTVCSSGCDFTSIQAAVDAASDGDTIELGAETYQESVVLPPPPFPCTCSGDSCGLSIRGAGKTATVVEGESSTSVFRQVGNLWCDSALRLSDMTIRLGRIGISTYNVTIFFDNLIVSDNTEGGVEVQWSSWEPPIVPNWKGAINNSTIHHNGHSPQGHSRGGLYFWGANFAVRITNTTVSENRAVIGGGVHLIGDNYWQCDDPLTACYSFAYLNIQQSTIAHNTATDQGGGIAVGGGSVTLENSTVTSNHAPFGGGIMVDYFGLWWADLDAHSSTIANNDFGGIADAAGFGFSFFLERTILAGNTGGSCQAFPPFYTSYSLTDDDSCYLAHPTDLVNMNPLLLPLADNGGPTPTHALAPDSPAIDAGGGDCSATDQRGVARPQDGDGDGVAKCDIGAYEVDVLAVNIDIKPDSYPNSINPYSRGVIPVALLGNDTFDVAEIDVTTLAFGPGAAPLAHLNGHLQDVDYDGIMDLVTHYRMRDTGIACGDESATLTGETLDGQPIEGSDSIQTVGCRETRRPAIWMKDLEREGKPRSDGPINIERK